MADMEDVMRGIFVLPNEVGLVVLTLSKHRLTMSMYLDTPQHLE